MLVSRLYFLGFLWSAEVTECQRWQKHFAVVLVPKESNKKTINRRRLFLALYTPVCTCLQEFLNMNTNLWLSGFIQKTTVSGPLMQFYLKLFFKVTPSLLELWHKTFTGKLNNSWLLDETHYFLRTVVESTNFLFPAASSVYIKLPLLCLGIWSLRCKHFSLEHSGTMECSSYHTTTFISFNRGSC